jgi:eukaryotic-like serine/threonine-protein kinase
MPVGIPELASLSAAEQTRVSDQCREFSRELAEGRVGSLAEHLKNWDGNARTVLLRELLLIEVLHEKRSGREPSIDDYHSRFADSTSIVDSIFDHVTAGSSSGDASQQETIDSVVFAETIVESEVDEADVATIVPEEFPQTHRDVARVDPKAETARDQASLETHVESDSNPLDVATLDQSEAPPTKRGRTSLAASSLPPDYELLGILGQGGMGLVYKARQKRADRIVALKVIRPEKLNEMSSGARKRAIERFRTEAQAAGRLQHDNLVTVYEVGEFDGCHFFSMQYVEGKSLSELIREHPIEDRQAAAYIEPVCRAVQSAHEQGILHRDIKPQNILIETATQRARIADFGLAKIIDADIEVTRAGESMGTPPYMPPEQFGDAASVTAAADVYSLGATLYHLLSGRPPFQSATAMTTMKQVLEKEPVALTELNAAVDKDLETICMKCLEKEPARRYASAGDLADELRRYLKREPILARPLGPVARSWRWCRRNPVVASLSAAVAVAICVAVTSLAVANVRTEESRQLSEASFQDALGAVNDFFTRVSEDRLLNEPGFQVLRRDLLELARNYYGQLIERRSGDPALEEEVAASHFRLGLIIEELDSADAARASYDAALDLQRELCRQKPDSKVRRQALSKTINALGRLATRNGDFDAARQYFDETLSLRESLVRETANAEERFEFDRLLANGWMNIGLLHRNQQQFEQARELIETAQEHRKKVLPVRPNDRAMRRDLAKGWFNLANLGVDLEDTGMVQQNVAEAIRELERLLTEDPEDLGDRYMLGVCFRLLADLNAARSADHPELITEAIENYSKALMASRDLAGRNPAVPRYRDEAAQLLLNLAQLEAERGQFAASRELIKEAEALLQVLATELPDNTNYAESLRLAREMLSRLNGL